MAVLAAIAGVLEARMEEVKAELMGVFRDELDRMLVEISKDYEIDLDELQEKYEIFGEAKAPEAPKKAAKPRKAKSDSDGESERKKCAAKTAKGAPCKNFALHGSTFCACHGKSKAVRKDSKVDKLRKEKPAKKLELPSSDEESESEVEVPKRVYKRPGKAPVTHSHKMESKVHEDCEACSVIGNVAAEKEDEKVEVSEEVKSLLDELFEGSGSDTEDEGSMSEIDA